MVELFDGADVLVIDCLKREPHPTHAHLAMSLELAEAARVRTAVLTHMDRSMDYAAVSSEVPGHVLVGYDGLVIEA
jgi:phosphoribosyl 1,2-cyclic phosphate phosphodiesterase